MKTEHDWTRADAMSDDEIHAAALGDPDLQPLTPERLAIPLGTLRDWEEGLKEPDAAARAYLIVIERNPLAVREALNPAPV